MTHGEILGIEIIIGMINAGKQMVTTQTLIMIEFTHQMLQLARERHWDFGTLFICEGIYY